MVDFKNKELLKVMWLPGEDGILFIIKNETPVPVDSKLYGKVFNNFNLHAWKGLYKKCYDSWLNANDESIYDINNEVNQSILNALIKINQSLDKEMVLYWFDIDRTENENYIWEFCPISQKRLINLGDDYPKINSLISTEYPLIFPL